MSYGDGIYIGWNTFWTPGPSKTAVTVLYALAFAFVGSRLGIRALKKKLSWDDAAAALGLIVAIPLLVLFTLIPSNTLLPQGMTPEHINRASAWTFIIGHDVVIWASRLSIAYTIYNAIPVGAPDSNTQKQRRISRIACWSFIGLWIAVMISQIFVCGPPNSYNGRMPNSYPMCWVPYYKAPRVVSLVADILGTLWIVVWPIYAFKLAELRGCGRLVWSFVILTPVSVLGLSIGCIVATHHSSTSLPNPRRAQDLWHAQVPLALMVCNFLSLAVTLVAPRGQAVVAPEPSMVGRVPISLPGDFKEGVKDTDSISDEGDYEDIQKEKRTSQV